MNNTNFLHPEFFWLFLVIIPAITWYLWKKKQLKATVTLSQTQAFQLKRNPYKLLFHLLFMFRILALCFFIVALARPQTVDVSNKTKTTKGIDIVMAIDVSSSMLAKDLKPDRLTALKKVAADFVVNRVNDRIGVVVYAGESYTRTPVTSDKGIVLNALRSIKYDNLLQDGTAIGMGLATAINRLKDSKAKSKVIILLTDGVNNAGTIEPETASQIAQEYGIKVYTIGLGSTGMAEFPYAIDANGKFLFRLMPVEIDEQLMKNIAKNTQGKYFRATSNSKLSAIYEEINKLETTEIEEQKFYNYEEKYRPWVMAGLSLLVLELLLRNTLLKGFI